MKKYLLICLGLAPFFTRAQQDQNSELYRTIISKDSLLFTIGFNTCDISQFEKLLSNDFEFYHDIDGFSDRNKFLNDLKNGLCGNPGAYQARRELLAPYSNVYALHKNGQIYGAVQEGVHEFFEKQTGQPERFGSSAKFTHFWLLENNQWKLSRSYSFEHTAKRITTSPLFDNDAQIEQWLKENHIPTLGIGTITDGKLNQIKVFGGAYNSIFNVASLTKPVTALVALKLVEQGKLDLDEPLFKYWIDPDITHDARHKKLTIRLILSHQSGFKNWRWLNENEKLSFDFEPGKGYQYSGEGFEYLRKALENKFKKPLQQLAEELIFEPLQMNDTRYVWDTSVDMTRYATNFSTSGKAYEVVKNSSANAADDLLTTIEDYGKFLTAIINGELLSDKFFKEMAIPHTSSEKGKHFGLGFEIYDMGNGEYCLAHGGADFGVRTIVFMFPQTKQGLLIFTNSDTGGNAYEMLVKHYLGIYGQKIIDIETKQ